MTDRSRRSAEPVSAVTALVLALWVALLGVVVPGVALLAPGAAAPPAPFASDAVALGTTDEATDAVLAVHVRQFDPIIAVPGRDVRAQVSVTNSGADSTTGPVRVQLRLGAADALQTRSQVRDFAAGGRGVRADRIAASATTPGPLAANATIRLAMTIPARSTTMTRAYGALPVVLDAAVQTAQEDGRGARATRATFLPFQSRKEYQPLDLSVVVPLTLGPDPALVSATGEDRAQAWQRAIGTGSRIDRAVSSTADFPVTWALDPALLDTPGYGQAAGQDAERLPSPTGTQTAATPAAPDPVAPTATPPPGQTEAPVDVDPAEPVQRALRQRLAQLRETHPMWALPRSDPDLPALLAGDADPDTLRRLLGTPVGVEPLLGVSGVARVAWPVGTPLSAAATRRVRAAYGSGGPTATLVPASAYDADPDVSGTAVRHGPDGGRIITIDDELSALLGSAQDADAATELTLRALAETVTLLAESPGRPRLVVIAPGRDFSPDPTAVRSMLAALSGTPWIRFGDSYPLIAPETTAVEVGSPREGATDPFSPGPSPLTAEALPRIQGARSDVAGMSSVLSQTPDSLVVPDSDTIDALASTRWRFAPGAWEELDRLLVERIAALTTGVSVVPSTINFFADNGVLQFTVVNRLDVEVHDVHVVLEPQGRPPRLRVVSDPGPLTIRPGSRTTVRVQVEAVAAGVVPVSTYLATPANTRLGTDATVRVRVQPTNGWVMLALGGLVGVVFLAGLYRALRAGRPRVPSENLKEIDQ